MNQVFPNIQILSNNFIVKMTKYIRQKNKRHQPITSTSPTIFQNQCKTEVTIKQKNIDKLVFVDSDDEEHDLEANGRRQLVQSSRQPRKNHDFNSAKRKSLAYEFKASSSGLKPSLMRTDSFKDEDYDNLPSYESSHVPKSNKIKFLERRQSGTLRNNYYFDQFINQRDLARQGDNCFQILGQKDATSAKPKAQINVEKLEKKHKNIEPKQDKISIPKLQITSLYFQVSDEEPTNQPQSSADNPQNIESVQLKAEETKEQKQEPSGQEQCEQPALSVQTQLSEPQIVDITDVQPNLRLQKRSEYIQQILSSKPSLDDTTRLVYSPILAGTKQIFEVNVYSSFSEKEYYFWLNMSTEMRLMMKATKSIKLHKTQYQISIMHGQNNHLIPVSKIVSNLDRSRFNVYTVDLLANSKLIVGTITTSVNIHNKKLLVLYHPKVDQNNTSALFPFKEDANDLQQLYRQNKTANIDYTLSTRLSMTTKLQVMSHYELRASEKSMEFKNNQGQINLIIGKKGSKRYKIIAGPGLTPVQIFSMVIVQIET